MVLLKAIFLIMIGIICVACVCCANKTKDKTPFVFWFLFCLTAAFLICSGGV